MMHGAASLRDRALAAARSGDDAVAVRLFAEAAVRYPRDAALLNSAGNFHARAARHDEALSCFDRAIAANADFGEAIVNRAITLAAMGKQREALSTLCAEEHRLRGLPRYWSARAGLEVALDDRVSASRSYEQCLSLAPTHALALHGRARMALDRGEDDMVERFDRALALAPGDALLWLGRANALDHVGRTAEARQIAEALVEQLPEWPDALELLAQLRWAAGERQDFCLHYAVAVRRFPHNALLYRSWCRMLAGVDRYHEAADAAGIGHRACPEDPELALREAVHRGEAGEDDVAEAIFARLTLDTDDRSMHEARHWLRREEPERAERLLAPIAEANGPVAAWALRDIAWRMLQDPRHAWLHQDTFVRLLPLELSDRDLHAAIAVLDRFHDTAAMPIGQSVRDGSQTRGGLFDRGEAEIARFHEAVVRTITRYRNALPPRDDGHPLLRYRDAPMRVAGSWSVRLMQGGFHTGHIHPEGVLSSACYLSMPEPESADPFAGGLELGRPPADLRLALPPVQIVKPELGFCALFPSTLYHGTRRFSTGKRMTVAFDVAPYR
ncbi:putative 2OG-Fe(II) oxygenase [Sphingomonas faeni]|uniref:putative 2OG-Fe(II) oxygenase n=1 Tax=Sphingomonas faeni TaxID=185950 RepID=UPI0027840737|nr:putative 2OG-Fe(II) oxygenase [Sphingomonas faeni]MDQ0840053.1 tetratricopeptide (TPR) repeat protein [Sphingomonas faeni]